jgi:hypothetical protein
LSVLPERLAWSRPSFSLFLPNFGSARALVFGVMMFAAGAVESSARAADSRGAALQWESAKWGRRARVLSVGEGKDGFTLMPPAQTGVTFTNLLSDARAAENQIRLNGAGVALGDVDGDGWCDVYMCGLESGNRLYRNLGQWKFEDITAAAGVGCNDQYSTGATLVDVDGDGDLDLLVGGVGTGIRIFLNDGKGRFTEDSANGNVRQYCATTVALGDIDGDGDLDLYVANYRTDTVRSTGMMFLRVGEKRQVRPEDRDRLELTPDGRVLEFGEPDIFYLNDGKGRFTPEFWTNGRFQDRDGRPLTRQPFDWGLTVLCRDLNEDGAPDFYVCNDFQTDDRIWLNDGRGSFRPAPPLMFRHTPSFSMCVDMADINRDGHFDLFIADMLSRSHARRLMQLAGTMAWVPTVGLYEDRPQFDRNVLQLNQGDTTFVDIAPYAGLAKTEWNWEAAFIDVDLDGYEDLLCTTSHMFDTQDLDAENYIRSKGPWPKERVAQKLLLFPRMAQPKQAFRNRGDLTFEDAGEKWGFNQVGTTQGMAFGDLDNDGDQEVVVNNLNGPAGLYRNNSSAPRVLVRLRGIAPNTCGIGAKVSLIAECAGKEPASQPHRFVQSQEICAGGRYLSSDEPARAFAADVTGAMRRLSQNANLSASQISLKLEVAWRSGRKTSIHEVMPNFLYEIDEAAAELSPAPVTQAQTPSVSPLFEDVSPRIRHSHRDAVFDDYERQPLLPRKLSHAGPGVAWFDFDGDGHEDLIVGGGRAGLMAVYGGKGDGSFATVTNAAVSAILTRDQTGIVGISDGSQPGNSRVLAGSSNYEDGQAAGALVRTYDLKSGAVQDSFPGQESSTGPLAVADVDGDGTLDLFVGGRCVPGKWPKSASSLLFRGHGQRFDLDMTNTVALAGAGLVSGATFADLNGDGWPDLVLACEWGPVRVFLNTRGVLREATSELGLEGFVGWWNGITTGDFDGDGRLDLAVSNWGLNGGSDGYGRPALVPAAANQTPAGVPLLYWGEFEGAVGMGLIEAEYDPAMGKIVPIRAKPSMEVGFPFVAGKFATFAAYNNAAVSDVLGDQFAGATRFSAPWLATTAFLNRGAKFEPILLPAEAQFSPAYGICAADFDGDGAEDLALTQNFFHVQPEAVRCDAGRGILLKGDGRGGFKTVPATQSGIKVYGEGRGAAVADFDEDGRVDLAVGQNGAATVLLRNRGAKPGLRVRLQGPPGNPAAIGAQVRLRFGKELGPVHEVRAGGGYWSQDSSTLVMGTPAAPDQIWVRWHGGVTNSFPLPAGRAEVVVSREGINP